MSSSSPPEWRKATLAIPFYVPAGMAKEERTRLPVWIWRKETLSFAYEQDLLAHGLDASFMLASNVLKMILKKDSYADEVLARLCEQTNKRTISKTCTLLTVPILGMKLQRYLNKHPTRNEAYEELMETYGRYMDETEDGKFEEEDVQDLRRLYNAWNPIEIIVEAIFDTYVSHELENLEISSERWSQMMRKDLLPEWSYLLATRSIPSRFHSTMYLLALSWFEDAIYIGRMDRRARKRLLLLKSKSRSSHNFNYPNLDSNLPKRLGSSSSLSKDRGTSPHSVENLLRKSGSEIYNSARINGKEDEEWGSIHRSRSYDREDSAFKVVSEETDEDEENSKDSLASSSSCSSSSSALSPSARNTSLTSLKWHTSPASLIGGVQGRQQDSGESARSASSAQGSSGVPLHRSSGSITLSSSLCRESTYQAKDVQSPASHRSMASISSKTKTKRFSHTLLTALFDVILEYEEMYDYEHADKTLSRMWFTDCVKIATKHVELRLDRQRKRNEEMEKQKEREIIPDRIIITKLEPKKRKKRDSALSNASAHSVSPSGASSQSAHASSRISPDTSRSTSS